MTLPNPKWSIYIGFATGLMFGGGMFLLAITSHNYCNEFCTNLMCDTNGSCNKINWLHLINYFSGLFGIFFLLIFIPSYLFQILDTYIKGK